MPSASWWENPILVEAPLLARLFVIAGIFACLYVADWLATGRSFNLRAFIAATVGGTAVIWLVGEIL